MITTVVAQPVIRAVCRASSVGRRVRTGGLLGFLGMAAVVGCAQKRPDIGVSVSNSPPLTVAVAPAMNFSGSSNWDPVRVADLMASELSQLPGINVVGVNRVLAVLARQGRDGIVSPAHALAVCDQLGVDAILVFAITEFDPYVPPVVALAAQLYGPHARDAGFDPVAASRQARPFATDTLASDSLRPWAEVQRTYNGMHESVQKAVEAFARPRDADRSPMGWRKYLASQELYLRFCCHNALQDLMRAEPGRTSAESVAMSAREANP